MKTEIIKQITVKLEKEDKELIRKVIALIGNLINTGDEYDCHCYEINNIYRETEELEDIIDFLKDLVYTENIELT